MKYIHDDINNANRGIEEGASSKRKNQNRIDGSWLKKQVENQFEDQLGGMTVNDLCSSIFDMLASSKSDEALQNDVS